MDLATFDIALRGCITGLLAVLTVLILMSRITREAQISYMVLAIAAVCRLWGNLSPGYEFADGLTAVLRAFGALSGLALTWFIVAIFLDDRRRAWIFLTSGLLITFAMFVARDFPPLVPYLRGYVVFHMFALMVLVIYSGRDDLQDARRRLRPAMAAFLLLYGVGNALTSTPMQGAATVGSAFTQSLAFAVIQIIFAIWALKANLDHWPGKIDPAPASEPTRAERNSAQDALIARINAAMGEGVWRVEGLTVGQLARHVGVPEHQVRKAINQGLGYRNFASFINRARVDAAKSRLTDPDALGQTVLEIAFDVGFSSLGPFNRAFREETGQSPTDFRRTSAG